MVVLMTYFILEYICTVNNSKLVQIHVCDYHFVPDLRYMYHLHKISLVAHTFE